MLKPHFLLSVIACALVFNAPSFAEDANDEVFTVVPHGFAGLQTFRIMGYKNQGVEMGTQNFNNSVLNFTFDLVSGKFYTIHAGLEGYVAFSTVPYDKMGDKFGALDFASPMWAWYMASAEMSYALNNENFFGIPDDVFRGAVGIGLFPYKYNEDARNLGEFLFRSGTYPGWLKSTFDWTSTRLTGLRLQSTLFNVWKNDLMLTTEMETYPFYDLSFTWMTGLPVGKILDLGAGVSLCRFLPSNSKLTTPELKPDASGGFPGAKTMPNFYVDDNGDTAFYTFSGTKLMTRMSLDPKGFLGFLTPGSEMFQIGKEDFKIFGEAAILGLENQGDYYKDVFERMPLMFGINIPTLNILELLSLQFEYYGSPYPNNYENQLLVRSAGVPTPTTGYFLDGSPYHVADTSLGLTNFYTKDNWKWSIYVRKWFGTHLAVVGQAARDHWRTSGAVNSLRDTEEALSSSKHWYWALKIVSVW